MRHVLDTHAALWNALAPENLGAKARAALAGLPAQDLLLSDVTLSEIARLIELGKISIPGDELQWMRGFERRHVIVPVDSRIALKAARYTFPHRDPCDRHILATAHVLGLPLVTVDKELTKWAPGETVKVIW
jgi:PIN domain nuclease of toxin-antitoxin system